MNILALSPSIFAMLLVLSLFINRKLDLREALIWGAVIWGMIVTAITELLGALNLIFFWPLAITWIFLVLVQSGVLISLLWKRNSRLQWKLKKNLQLADWMLLVCIASIALFLAAIAWVTPPNTWDSMTYHSSRVVHWIQNGNVDFYPTHILRQLHQAPWSEFSVLQFQVLSAGHDSFSNFVQFFSMVGCLIGVSLIARELGASVTGQIVSSVACCSIPMGILQSTSTQTDYAVSLWLVCFAYFLLRFTREPNLLRAIGLGGSIGLAFLTKGTAYLYAFPFILLFGILVINRLGSRIYLRWLAVAIVCATALNAGHFERNFALYGSPLGPGNEGQGFGYSNEIFNLSSFQSGLIRNVSLHLGTPFPCINDEIELAIKSIHDRIGLGDDDPRTTWGGTKFHVSRTSFHEDLSGNLLHFFLIIFSFIVYFVTRAWERRSLLYVTAVIFGFFIFCGYLKWQPWGSRLQLPIFILFTPFIGLTASKIRWAAFPYFLSGVMLVCATPWLLENASKPASGSNNAFEARRDIQLFTNNQALYLPYTTVASFLKANGCFNVGLKIGGDDWEYPLWSLLAHSSRDKVNFEHIQVENISKKTRNKRYDIEVEKQCAIFVAEARDQSNLNNGYANFNFALRSGEFSIYLRDPRN